MSAAAAFKALARDTCGQLLSLSGLTSPRARLHQRLSIVTFHRVLTESQRRMYPLPGLAVTPDELDAHLRFLTRHFQCLSLNAALDLWERDARPERPLLAITFDDGQLDNHLYALPVLERHGVTASFYVPSQVLDNPAPLWHDAMAVSVAGLTEQLSRPSAWKDPSERDQALVLLGELQGGGDQPRANGHTIVEAALEVSKAWSPQRREDWRLRAQRLLPPEVRPDWDGFMSVAQMKDLIARGHEIGSHSHSHALLPQCTPQELVAEIAGSRQRLELALGSPITTFCYPNGSTDAKSVAQVREAGYRAAVTTRWGSNARGDDLCRLQRFNMNAKHAQDRRGHFSGTRLAWRMSGWHPGLGAAKEDAYAGSAV